jgi:membrane protease YdiL (CAAX protease family)
MKPIINRFPFVSKILLAIVLGFAAIALSSIIYDLIPIKPYFPFVGELLLVFATWLLYKTDKQDLSAIGLTLRFRNTSFLFIGLVIGIAAVVMATWLRTVYTGEVWHISSAVDGKSLIKSLYFILPTVVVQELMFRGYLFTKTINKFGIAKANIIFSILFMLVHVLDRDVLQNLPQIIFLAISIPVGHLWFAVALQRSKTLFFPIGLHWGNNWAVVHLAGMADSHQQFFYLTNQKHFTTWTPFVIILLLFNVCFLLVTLIIWKSKYAREASLISAAKRSSV